MEGTRHKVSRVGGIDMIKRPPHTHTIVICR